MSGCDVEGGGVLLGASEAELAATARLFRVMSDPGRLAVLTELVRGECCVGALAERLDEKLSTVSQRLRILQSERFVQRRRDGKHIFYALADHHVVELIGNGLAHAREHHDV